MEVCAGRTSDLAFRPLVDACILPESVRLHVTTHFTSIEGFTDGSANIPAWFFQARRFMSESRTPDPVLLARLFEKAPHVIVVLDPGLAILAVNEAGARFFGMDALYLTGMSFFAVVPDAGATGTGWQERLRQSYAQVLATGVQVSLLLLPQDGLSAAPGLASVAAVSATPADGCLWHVCHAPLHDEHGALVAITTYALLLEGVETAIARISDVATAQRTSLPAPAAPLTAAGEAATMPPAAAPGSNADRASAAAPGAGLRILMVEDNDDLRTVNVDQLEMLGHHVTSTADAEQALRHLETSTFDLLFTDLTLPRMTGAELARLVLQQHHPMRVVITSGYGRAMANAQSLDALFLPKPYRFADLQEVLRQVRLRRDA